MIPGIAYLFLINNVVDHDPDGQWTVNYNVTESGPVTNYVGFVSLNLSDEISEACFDYVFEYEEGEVFGPSVSSEPDSPILPFDSIHIRGVDASVSWCESASPYQVLPVQVPRFFNFSVRKSSSGPDDLARLLADWGGATWDLNGDQVVDGADLNLLLQGWNVDSGEAS